MADKRKSLIWQIASLILLTILLVSAVTLIFLTVTPTPPPQGNVLDENGNVMTPGEVYDMSNMIFRKPTAAEGNLVSKEGVTIKATVKPDDAPNKEVDWVVAFKNSHSYWANNKNVNEYVTVTPTGDGATTATVNCLRGFGEQIIITVISRDNPSAKAECTVDYAETVYDIYNMRFGDYLEIYPDYTEIYLEASSTTNLGGPLFLDYSVNVGTIVDEYEIKATLTPLGFAVIDESIIIQGLPEGDIMLYEDFYFDRNLIDQMYVTIDGVDGYLKDIITDDDTMMNFFNEYIVNPELYEIEFSVIGQYSQYSVSSVIAAVGATNTYVIDIDSIDLGGNIGFKG